MCSSLSPTAVLARGVGELRAPAARRHPARGHLPGPRSAPGPRLRPEVRKRRRALSRRWVGWDGEGEGRRGVGGGGAARGARQPEHPEVRGVQRAARSPEAPSSCYCCGDRPGPGQRLSRLSWGKAGCHTPPASWAKDPHGPRSHLLPRPRWVSSGRRDSHKLPPARPTAVIVPRAPPTSTAPAAPASTPGLRAQQLRAPGCRGRGGFGLCVQQGRWAINTRGRRRWERAIRAGGDRPRSEPSKVAWGGGEGGAGRVGGERAQGRHGRLDARPSAAGAESSGAKRAVAASPPRAQPSSRSPAPARDPPPPRPASGK